MQGPKWKKCKMQGLKVHLREKRKEKCIYANIKYLKHIVQKFKNIKVLNKY